MRKSIRFFYRRKKDTEGGQGSEGPAIESEIIYSTRFRKAEKIPHHNSNVASHSKRTAMYGRRMCRWLKRHGIQVSEEDVITACLLHDIGMTDDDVSESVSWKKAFLHPRRGKEIAEEEYQANHIQTNAIRRHMWPIGLVPPGHKEGWIVMTADKCSSIWEVIHRS